MISALQIKNLSIIIDGHQHEKIVVNDLNLQILAGQCIGVVGESGSGKSLTALAILQLLPQNSLVAHNSQILFYGKDILTYTEREMRQLRGNRIAIIFQDAMSAFNPVLTIWQQIEEVLVQQAKLVRTERFSRAISLLEEVGISDPHRCLHAYPHELSGGMRQRAMIAMALAGEPELLIADEPTTALDVTIQAQIIQLLRRLQRQRNMAMLFISHHLVVVAQLADHIVVLRRGQVMAQASAQQFFHTTNLSSYSLKLLHAALPTQDYLPPLAKDAKPLLNVEALCVYFPIRQGLFKKNVATIKAVDQVNFNLAKSETLALIGESGCGKTTIGKALLRLLPNISGRIEYAGVDLLTLSPRKLRKIRAELQMIFQDPFAALNPRMLIADSIIEGMLAQNIAQSRQQALLRVDELLQQVELAEDVKWRYPHEFSGGERQRICIARALAMSPRLLILDEPTSALDLTIQKQILDLLRELQRKFSFSYLLITHDMSVVAYMAHRVAVMRQGCIVEYGAVQTVLQEPQHPYTKQLLAAVPVWPGPG